MSTLQASSSKGVPNQRIRRQIAQLEESFTQAFTAVQSGRPLDVRLAEIFAGKRELGSRDRRLIKDTVYSYFRWMGWLDRTDFSVSEKLAIAGHLAFPDLPPALQTLARDHGLTLPAVDSQDLSAVKIWMESIAGRTLAVADLVPSWVLGSLTDPAKSGLPDAWQKRPPVWLRCLKGKQKLVQRTFESEGYTVFSNPVIPLAIRVDRAFPESKIFNQSNRGFYIQDLASQAVGEVCLHLGVESWWDACAGSGGKSFILADSSNSKVFASDSRAHITRALQKRKQALGLHLTVGVLDASRECPRQGLFTGVLVDAPCSGLGTWSRNPDHRWRSPESDIGTYSLQQIKILQQASDAVAPGGFLVYSVCTVTASETEGVAKSFLRKNSNWKAVNIPHPIYPDVRSPQVWVHPSDGPCNGMFIAVFQKGFDS